MTPGISLTSPGGAQAYIIACLSFLHLQACEVALPRHTLLDLHVMSMT